MLKNAHPRKTEQTVGWGLDIRQKWIFKFPQQQCVKTESISEQTEKKIMYVPHFDKKLWQFECREFTNFVCGTFFMGKFWVAIQNLSLKWIKIRSE